MIEYYKAPWKKGKIVLAKLNAQEHFDYLINEVSLYGDKGCWYLESAPKEDGYPTVNHRGKTIPVTHLILANKLGCEVSDIKDQSLKHVKCPNTLCVNPNHYEIDT